MSVQYNEILKTGKMGPWELRNRLIMAPMGSLNATDDGFVTQNTLDFYYDMAKGGNSMIIVECTYMDEDLSKGEDNCMGLTRNSQITGMKRLATVIKDQGCVAILQLCHIGHQLALKKESLGPSEMTEMLGGVIPFPIRGMTREEIRQCIDDFAMAAWRAKMAGFDGVEIHGAIGHLINMFCTPSYNHRTDEYGGSPENRIRFMKEIIEAVQEKCGKDFPIIGRICGCDFDPDGITMEEGIIHAKIIEQTGVVALHIVGGSNNNVMTINCQYDPRGAFIPIAKALKEAGIKVPIILDGGLNTPDLANQVLADGICDYVGIGRPMLADPDWILKLEEDRPEDIRPCIRCAMGCVGTVAQFDAACGLRCSVNPTCNLTGIRKLRPIRKVKNVCIVGGGPAGMEAAMVLTERGHKVTLYEKKKLGGMMNQAAFDPDVKGDIQRLIDYFVVQMEKLPVNLICEEATEEKILAGGFDVVIDATGSVPTTVKYESSANVKVHSLYDFASDREMPLGERVVIVGGCFPNEEMAYSLLKKGHRVTLSTRRSNPAMIGAENSSPQMQRLAILGMTAGMQVMIGSNFIGVNDEGAVIENIETKEQSIIPCDDVLVCRGFHGSKKLYNSLQGKVKEIYRIGDSQIKARCSTPTTIGNAIEDGWVIANRI